MANQYDTNLKLQAIADAIGDTSSSGLISALEDIADAVAGGGGGSSAGLVSDNFSETDTYDLGDYCIHNNTMYVCINAITTPGPWDLSDWQATNAGLQLSSLNSAIANLPRLKSVDFDAGAVSIDQTGTNDMYYRAVEYTAPADAVFAVNVDWVGTWNAVALGVSSNLVNGKFQVHFMSSKQVTSNNKRIRVWYVTGE